MNWYKISQRIPEFAVGDEVNWTDSNGVKHDVEIILVLNNNSCYICVPGIISNILVSFESLSLFNPRKRYNIFLKAHNYRDSVEGAYSIQHAARIFANYLNYAPTIDHARFSFDPEDLIPYIEKEEEYPSLTMDQFEEEINK